MKRALWCLVPVLISWLLPLSGEAGGFSVSLPADSAVTVEAPSRLLFRVTNTDASEGLSRLALRFPAGYRITGGSPPPGWSVELGASESGELSFRTADEAKCGGAIAPGSSLVFGVEVTAPASRSVTPDSLAAAQAEQSCRGVVLDPPGALPSWDRMGLDATLTAGPPLLGVGGTVTVTMTVTNLSTVELTDISPLLSSSGTASVSGVAGPTPLTLNLAPGALASMSWVARVASAGTLGFSGQAVSKAVASAPVRSDALYVADLDVSLSVTPEQVASGQDVRVEMTVTNRGPIRVTNVTPSSLAFGGTAVSSAAAGPSPASLPVLEPGGSAIFAWAATITGAGGETYAFSGWASAEWGAIVSTNATSNLGVLAQQQVASDPEKTAGGGALGGGGLASAGSTTTSAGSSGRASGGGGVSAPPAGPPSATLQFIGVNLNGTQVGGTDFSGSLLGDLRIIVGWQNVAGTHTQRLDFFSPDGSLYQRLSTQFTQSSVETRLLVGGTWITQYSLFGAWRVEVFLDREQMPISSGVFVLNP